MIFAAITGVIILLLAIEFIQIRFNGKPVAAPDTPRGPEVFGVGPKLTYVVMGDSTAIGQGADYNASFARQTAQKLAERYEVTLVNTGVSGATAKTVLDSQAKQAASYKPDLVVLAVGANDVTKLTDIDAVTQSFQQIIDDLKAANPNVAIVATRSPAVDAVSRFGFGARTLAKWRVAKLNTALEPLLAGSSVTTAPVAEQTRQPFLDDPSLLAADNFHPNGRGYALWTPVINQAIDQALAR